MLIERQHK